MTKKNFLGFLCGVLVGTLATFAVMRVWQSSSPAHPADPPDAPPVSAASAGSIDEAIAGLETRLASGGGTQEDWLLLAQSYEFLGRKADAQQARARAKDRPAAAGDSGAAHANLDATLDAWLNKAGTAGSEPAAQILAPVEVSGVVSLDRKLTSQIVPGSVLFIYAKAADSPGPPLAVLRMPVGDWPVSFKLDDSSAMIPERKLSQFDRVTVEARISRSGQAMPAAGDFYAAGEVLRPADRKPVALTIDRSK